MQNRRYIAAGRPAAAEEQTLDDLVPSGLSTLVNMHALIWTQWAHARESDLFPQ